MFGVKFWVEGAKCAKWLLRWIAVYWFVMDDTDLAVTLVMEFKRGTGLVIMEHARAEDAPSFWRMRVSSLWTGQIASSKRCVRFLEDFVGLMK